MRPAAEVSFPSPLAQGEFATFNGLIVRVDVAEIDEAKWVRFEVDAGGPVAIPEQPATDGESDSASGEDEELLPLAEEVSAIREIISDWIFQLPEFANKNLAVRNAEMLAGSEES